MIDTSTPQEHLFTEDEAWNLFRIAAIGEAIGWIMLITGILIHQFITPHSQLPVQIAGKFHGTLFSIYLVGVLVIWRSYKKPIWLLFIAIAASVPPFGTLILELWLAHRRRLKLSHTQKNEWI
jgi:integral membrane protein